MTHFQIVAFYIALNLLLNPILMYRVGQVRMSEKVSLGNGDSPTLLGRVRAHGNFAETAPLALLGLIGLAMLSAPSLALHIFGAGFFLGRVLHAHGMAQENNLGKGRMIGTLLAILTFVGTALTLLFLIFTHNGT